MKAFCGGILALALGAAAAPGQQPSPPGAIPPQAASPENEPHPAPSPAAAAYNVELVVCRFTTALGVAEDWQGAALAAQADPDAAATGGRSVRPLASSSFQLNDAESRLRANGTCTPMAHFGWTQTASAWGTHDALDLRPLAADAPGLSGAATLERGEFLHLGLALDLTVADPPAGLSAAPGTTFTLRGTHRVRFYERNYFDSPAFGVIALVTPAQERRPGR